MIAWIRENAILASVLGGFIAVISSGAVAYHQLSNLIAKQPEVEQHIHDNIRHIDPMRDLEKIRRLEERVDQLERQQRWAERRQNGNREWEGRRGDRR